VAVLLGCDGWAMVRGKVVDENGKPVAGATIVVKQGESKVSENVTDAAGKIEGGGSICPLPGCSTDISVTVSKQGYMTVVRHLTSKEEANAARKGELTIKLVKE
jgi:hypothetical protein